jgi:DUF2970 family protein
MEGVMKASFLDTVKTVLWAAIGIRRRRAHDQAKINPVHVVIMGVAFAVLFVLTLVTIVRVVIS